MFYPVLHHFYGAITKNVVPNNTSISVLAVAVLILSIYVITRSDASGFSSCCLPAFLFYPNYIIPGPPFLSDIINGNIIKLHTEWKMFRFVFEFYDTEAPRASERW